MVGERRRRGRIVAVLGVVPAIVLGGCSGGASAGSGTSASPSSTVLASPTLPSAAGVPTAEGAKAFARHFFDVYNYAVAARDAAPLKAVSDPACQFCLAGVTTIETIKNKGDRTEGGQTVAFAALAQPDLNLDHEVVRLLVHQSEGRTLSSTGAVVSTTPAQDGRIDMSVRWTGERWLVTAARSVPDNES